MKFSLLVLPLAIATLVLSGCSNPFAKQVSQTSPQTLAESLAAQSAFKKFSSPSEVREFFEHRVQTGATATAGNMAADRAVAAKEAAAPMGLGGGEGFSTTNIQVAGVDESDIVKTDGQHIYAVNDKNILIFKARPAAETSLLTTLKLDSRPQEIYLAGNKLVVFGYKEVIYPQPMVQFVPQSPYTFLAVYDITDPAKPNLLRRFDFEGSYTASRMIEDRLYFITTTYNFYPAAESITPKVMENGAVISGDQSTDRYIVPDMYYIDAPTSYNTSTASVIDLSKLDDPLRSQVYFMPAGEITYASHNALYLAYTKYVSEYQLRMTAAREILFGRLSDRDRSRINQIDAIDSAILSDDEKANKVNQVIENYLSRLSNDERDQLLKNLDEDFNRRYPDITKELEKTVIHKIAFSEKGLEYKGSGEVIGRLLNQFSMDEKDGYLRLATTRNRSWFMPLFAGFSKIAIMPSQQNNDSYNNVYVLDENLKTVGTIEDLAKGERIYSARFMGDRAYIVTFKQTDPLFVIDLSQPTAPTVLGLLKIPGFSNYLHPYDETTLIGIGKEATDNGEQGVDVQGLKVSLFNVADPTSPKELASIALGGRGSDSVALYDYKAFLFSKEKNLLVLPATLTQKGTTDYQALFQGAIVFNVTATTLAEQGRINFRLPSEISAQKVYTDDTARRSLYIGDDLYVLSSATLKAAPLNSLRVSRSLDLPLPEQPQGVVPMPRDGAIEPAEPAAR